MRKLKGSYTLSIIFFFNILFGFELNINCGGSEQFLDGIIWEADREYSYSDAGYFNGYETIGMWQLGGSYLNSIFCCHRDSVSTYMFDVPNGHYFVKLLFIEQDNHGDNQRVMNVFIEDSLVLYYFDIHQLVEKDFAIFKCFETNVVDNTLEIDFDNLIGNTTISGIVIISDEPDSVSPIPVTWTNAYPSYGKIIVDWRENTFDNDFAGYYVYRTLNDVEWELQTSQPITESRYFDYHTEPGIEYKYKIVSVDFYGNASEAITSSHFVHLIERGDSEVPIVDLYLNDASLAFLNSNPFADEYVRGDFKYDDRIWEDVRIRYRGKVSRYYSKKNFKVNFDSEDRFFGIDKLNFNSEPMDITILRNLYGTTLFSKTGIDAPNVDYVSVWLNDDFYGLTISLEQVDERFLTGRGYSEDDYIYKNAYCTFEPREDYSYVWELECGEGYEDDFFLIDQFIDIINYTPDSEIETTLDSLLDIESVLRYYATITLIDDIDFSEHNFYLHRIGETGKWHIIPWDLNMGFQNSERELGLCSFYNPFCFSAPSLFYTRLIGIQSYRERYCDLLDSLSLTTFSSENVSQFVDSIQEYVFLDAQADHRKATYEDGRAWNCSLDDFDEIVRNRIEFVRDEIDEFREFNNPVGICINELCIYNCELQDESGEYEPYIELYNLGDETFDLSNLFLSDDPFYQNKWRLPSIMLEPNEYQIIWLDNETHEGIEHSPLCSFGLGGFVGLFDSRFEHFRHRSYHPAVDLLFYGEFSGGDSWQRFPDGTNNWSFSNPTPNGNNSFMITEDETQTLPNDYKLFAYPNPFNSFCKISRPENSSVDIFDIKGNLIQTLSEDEMVFSPESDLPTGIYLLRSHNNQNQSKKIYYVK